MDSLHFGANHVLMKSPKIDFNSNYCSYERSGSIAFVKLAVSETSDCVLFEFRGTYKPLEVNLR